MTIEQAAGVVGMTAAQLIIERLEEHARVRGDKPALAGGRADATYAELDARGNEVANALLALPRTAQPVVVTVGALDADTVALLLGVLKTGFVIAPLDPREPDDRLLAIAERLGARLVVVDGDRAARLSPVGPRSAVTAAAALRTGLTARPTERVDANGCIVVAATSGTTGSPKSVVLAEGAAGLLDQGLLVAGPDERCGILLPPAWMGAILPLVATMLAGATGQCLDLTETPISDVPRWMADTGLTTIGLTPSLLRGLVDLTEAEGLTLPALRRVSLTGEPTTGADVTNARQVAPNATFVLMYGSTDGGIIAVNEVGPDDEVPDGILPAGRPVAPFELRADDGSGRLVADGETGTIVATGPTLPLLVDGDAPLDLFAIDWAQRGAIEVGDFGRIGPDGQLEVLGRVDARVKVRGQMVDPTRVEGALTSRPDVLHAVVSVVPAGTTNELVAWVVPAVDPAPQARQLRRALARSVPGFMVPTRIVLVDELPRLSSGKADRAALAERAAGVGPGRPAVVAPATATEAWLVGVLEVVLGLDEVGRHDDVFELGADSLVGVELLVALAEERGVQVDAAELLDHPTVASLAALVDERTAPAARPGGMGALLHAAADLRPRDDGRRSFALRADGARAPLHLVPGGGANLFQLRPLALALTDRPVRELVPKGVETRTPPNYTVGGAARRYVEAVLADAADDQPLLVAGSSFGGLVAWEMARLLAEAGRRPDQLVLLDPSGFPGSIGRSPGQMAHMLAAAGALPPLPGQPAGDEERAAADDGRTAARHPGRAGSLWRAGTGLLDEVRRRSPRDVARSAAWHGTRAVRSVVPPPTLGLVRWPLATQEQLFLSVSAVASRHYRPQPYEGPVVVVRSTGGWGPLMGGAQPVLDLCRGDAVVVEVPGDHESMLRPPHVRVLAERLDEVLLA